MSTKHRGPKKPNDKGLHPRNLHRKGYDFPALIKAHPPLSPYVKTNLHGNLSIDFADPLAVKLLNASLLKKDYQINNWDIPEKTLCPPIPGRVDYIHYVADLLGLDLPSSKPTKKEAKIRLLDIGTGANGIYPLLACQIYGWHSVGSDINKNSLANVESIIGQNPSLKDRFTLRLQEDKNKIFDGIIQPDESFDISVCNPPFHASEEEAIKGSQRKIKNLAKNRAEQESTKKAPTLNFGGQEAELWCKGGEKLFLKKLIKESQVFASQCRWFSTLVSKNENVKPAQKLIRKLGASDIREIEMKQGNKITRILAWTFR